MKSTILNLLMEPLPIMPAHPAAQDDDDSRWTRVLERDGTSDGQFVFAVSSTGVYCRPSCPSRRPRRENVRFFGNVQEAENAGFRACMRCRPRAASGNPRQEMV